MSTGSEEGARSARSTGVAVGVAGLPALSSHVSGVDRYGEAEKGRKSAGRTELCTKALCTGSNFNARLAAPCANIRYANS